MNKKVGLISGAIVSSIFFAGLVSAAASDFMNALASFFAPLFGNQEIFTKVLFAILIYMILYSVVDVFFKGRKVTTVVISAIITILSVFFLPPSFITAIRDQYGIMGAAILSVIPFAIMLVFTVRVGSLLVGRVLWIFWAMYYLALYLYRIFTLKTGFFSAEVIPYLGALIVGIIIIFVLPAIRNAIFHGEMKAIEEEGNKVVTRAKLLHKIQKEELEGYSA